MHKIIKKKINKGINLKKKHKYFSEKICNCLFQIHVLQIRNILYETFCIS